MDPSSLIHISQPPTYEDTIKASANYETPETTNSTTSSMELPTSSITTARVDGFPKDDNHIRHHLVTARSLSDSCIEPHHLEDQTRISAR
ncbi:unnamed protein product [Caenorhabditis angaria]|uniref:Uncharacterized protein n=1 Tax=Caenorhabditis angaria TaxID=860376 RepID=A0A9P1IXA8_9PELO|nr:unnamed protein product [Caenorhabditis angaria]